MTHTSFPSTITVYGSASACRKGAAFSTMSRMLRTISTRLSPVIWPLMRVFRSAKRRAKAARRKNEPMRMPPAPS